MKIIIIFAVLIIASISDAAPSRHRRSPNDQYGNVVRQQIIQTQTGVPGMQSFPTGGFYQIPGSFETQGGYFNPGFGGYPNTEITGYRTSFGQPTIFQMPSYTTGGFMRIPYTNILQIDPSLTTDELLTTGPEPGPEISN